MRPLICFLSDFGLDDAYVGAVKGVILSIAPDATIVDLTHAIPPHDVRAGAFLLMTSIAHFPAGTVVLAVVDPGVGTERRPIAVEAGCLRFVAPDNGLASWAVSKALGAEPAAGDHLSLGVAPGVVLDRPEWWRPDVSNTFHGRDLFGPVAAHLARGARLFDVGSPIDSIDSIPFPPVRHQGARRRGEVIYVDRYGNLVTNVRPSDVPSAAAFRVGGRVVAGLSPHFQQEMDIIAVAGSSGFVEISVPNGSAEEYLDVAVGAEVVVEG